MTAQILAFPAGRDVREPRYFTGWWYCTNGQTGEALPEAYVRPHHSNWYGIYPASSPEEAAIIAIEMAAGQPDTAYEGGPENG